MSSYDYGYDEYYANKYDNAQEILFQEAKEKSRNSLKFELNSSKIAKLPEKLFNNLTDLT